MNGPLGVSLKLPIPQLPWLKVGSDDVLSSSATVNPARVAFVMPILPFVVPIVAGAASAAKAISPALSSTNTALSLCFEECCLCGLELEIRYQPAAAFETGTIIVAIDEEDAVLPTSSILAAPHLDISCAAYNADNTYLVKWKPSDLTDLAWFDTVTITPTAWCKFFAAPATTFTGGAQAGSLLVTGSIVMNYRQFRQ